MSARYRFISDPGHGWLEVDFEELAPLGIDKLISSCSYVGLRAGKRYAYLEEDCDLAVFLTAKFGAEPVARKAACGKFWSDETIEVFEENTFVRKLPSYPVDAGYNFKQAMAYCHPPAEVTQ